MMVVRSVVQPFLPRELRGFLFSGIRGFLSRFSNEMTMVIDEYDGINPNELYQAAQVFLPAKQFPSMRRVRVSKPVKEDELTLAMDQNQVLVDTFAGIKLKWVFASRQVGSGNRGLNSPASREVQFFELTFHKKHEEVVRKSYLPFIVSQARSMKQEKKTLKLYTVSFDCGYGGNYHQKLCSVKMINSIELAETLAMDLELKKKLIDDLERFVARKDYYRRVGKVWKRGYLLYGPPGTGKSSLVAAMANHLKFDIYDLELSGLQGDADLRSLLINTGNQSILVVEDIDCIVKLQDRMSETQVAGASAMSTVSFQENQVTLSGFLNFIDGLWSSCGDERIIVFTTNHKERLDSALLRPGRMDLHIPMSYCTPCGFRLLAFNYLGIDHHELFIRIESLLEKARVTPAEVAEQLLKSNEPEVALRDMVTFLVDHKREENEEVI
ncbi:hypothetical protein EUGRSUZ_J02377 [Eucalyptus grandis]|uniref:Uncharacterized protein n=1 Tax=Eucalyptus grandis TaxID=71139 RepID=A0ACC3J831_EUCGR|nr:hypothetical protein EUGRSUZ_J02377 [Eucalyptus grandis]